MITSSINSGPTLSGEDRRRTTTATNDGVARRRRRLWVTPRGPVEVAD